MARLSSW
jgi:branched-chain amino acid transport system substrate-binding protein